MERPRKSRYSNHPNKQIDNRPLQDKNYQKEIKANLLGFLQQEQTISGITSKQIQSPSAQDFLQILNILMQQLDPDYQFQGKLDEKVPLLFKNLGYPYPISKNALLAVGAPNSWPTLLGALQWLLDIVISHKNEQIAYQNQQKEVNQDRMYTEQMIRAYNLFLEGQDYNEELAELNYSMELRVIENKKQVEILQATKANYKEQKKELERKLLQPQNLENEIILKQQELQKLKQGNNYDDQIKNIQDQISFMEQEILVTQQELEQLSYQYQQILEQKSQQKLQPQEVQRLKQEIEQMKLNSTQIQLEIQQQEKTTLNAQNQASELYNQLNEIVRQNNKLAQSFKTEKFRQKLPQLADLEIHLKDINSENVIKVCEERQLIENSNQVQEYQQNKVQKLRQIQQNQLIEQTSMKQEIDIIEQQMQELKQQLQYLKKQALAAEDSLSEEGMIDAQILQTSQAIQQQEVNKKTLQEAIRSHKQQISQLKNSYADLEEEKNQQIKNLTHLIRRQVNNIKQHSQAFEKYTADLLTYSKSQKEELIKVVSQLGV